jgi:hypothetical protein
VDSGCEEGSDEAAAGIELGVRRAEKRRVAGVSNFKWMTKQPLSTRPNRVLVTHRHKP